MLEMKEVDPKIIDQAIRNASQLRSQEFHRVMGSMWRGVTTFFKAVAEGIEAGRKAPEIL